MNGAADEWISMICFLLAAMWNCDYFCIKGTCTYTCTQTLSQIIISFHLSHLNFYKHYTDDTKQRKKNKTIIHYPCTFHVISGWNRHGRQRAPYSKQHCADFCSVGIFLYWKHDRDLVMVSETPCRVWNNSPELHLQIKLPNVIQGSETGCLKN